MNSKFKAIVLTYDRNHPFTEHMIRQYAKLWPNHPFEFLIPYQHKIPGWHKSIAQTNFIQTDKDISQTVLTLIEHLDPEELIYWCIDDKFPIELNVSALNEWVQWIPQALPTNFAGISLCRTRKLLEDAWLTGNQFGGPRHEKLLERKTFRQFWLHQFIRVKTLRNVFNRLPNPIPFAKFMDPLVYGMKVEQKDRLWVSENNHMVFGESLDRSKITENCLMSMEQHQIEPPPETTAQPIPIPAIEMGTLHSLNPESTQAQKQKNLPFIFLRIDQTGSSEVFRALKIYQSQNKDKEIGKHLEFSSKENKTALELKRITGGNHWENAFKFCIVSNPWNRIFNQYRRITTRSNKHSLTPEDFRNWIVSNFLQKEKKDRNSPIFTYQSTIITNENGKLLVDFIGRLESIRADFRIICSNIGIKKSLRENMQYDLYSYRDFYSSQTEVIIGNYFAKDIELLKYKFR